MMQISVCLQELIIVLIVNIFARCTTGQIESNFCIVSHVARNAFCVPPDGARIAVNDTVTYTCFSGYRFPTGLTTFKTHCTREGHLFPGVPDCQITTCTVLKIVENATSKPPVSKGSLIPAYSTLTYTCLPGYVLPNGKTEHQTMCLYSEIWTHEVPTSCQITHCTVPNIYFAESDVMPGKKVNANVIVTYTCDTGFGFPGGQRIFQNKCMFQDKWSFIPPVSCEVMRCSVQHVPNSISRFSPGSLVEAFTMVTHECNTGFRFPNGKKTATSSCVYHEVWSVDVPACEVTHCTVQNGAHSTSGYADGALVEASTVIEHRCDPGYTYGVGTTMNTTCEFEETWSNALPVCQITYCTSQTITNGFSEVATGSKIKANNSLTYRCRSGYRFPDGNNEFTTQCIGEEKWIKTVPTCQAMYCTIFNGAHSSSGYDNESKVIVNSVVHHKCDNGYVFPSNEAVFSTTCDFDETWSVAVPKCQPVGTFHEKQIKLRAKTGRCILPNVTTAFSNATTHEVEYGQIVIYRCKEDKYVFFDGQEEIAITCDYDWNITIPDCRQFDPCQDYLDISDQRHRSLSKKIAEMEKNSSNCDAQLSESWYRFKSTVIKNGFRDIPTECVSSHSCGVQWPVWMKGPIPSKEDGIVERTVCMSIFVECCFKNWTIEVKNCSSYNVYHLKPTPYCWAGYCLDTRRLQQGTGKFEELIGPQHQISTAHKRNSLLNLILFLQCVVNRNSMLRLMK